MLPKVKREIEIIRSAQQGPFKVVPGLVVLADEVERLDRELTATKNELAGAVRERDEARAEVERLRREVPSEHDWCVMRAALSNNG